MSHTFLKIIILAAIIFSLTNCASSDMPVRAQQTNKPTTATKSSDSITLKNVVQRIIQDKELDIKSYSDLGKSLQALGSPAINELTLALDTATPANRSYIAMALSTFGEKARPAIPKLIETFPTQPVIKTGILLNRLPVTQQDLAALDKYDRGVLAVTLSCVVKNRNRVCEGEEISINSDASNWDPSKYQPEQTTFYIYTTPAAAALYKITGVFSGHTQEKWQNWFKTTMPK